MKISRKNKHRLVALFFILFFLTVYKCSGQLERMNRYKNNPEITTIFPEKPMKFNDGNNDTIYVSILADSSDTYQYSLFLFTPNPISSYRLEIGFVNGRFLTVDATRTKENFAEFELTEKNLKWLQREPFDVISFINNGVIQTCIQVKTKDFFINFFKELK